MIPCGRPCERWCPGTENCEGHWRHHSRFHSWQVKRSNGTVATKFARLCRDCQQKERNEKKNTDRPLAIITQRAATAAHNYGGTREFFMVHMNYGALVEPLRALLAAGFCQGCGHKFVNERDIQIDHIVPPRGPEDWARLHARNLRFFCQSCNKTKGAKPFDLWLEEQEQARLSNLRSRSESDDPPRSSQDSFDFS